VHFVKIGSTGINLDLVMRWDIYEREDTVFGDDGSRVKTGDISLVVQVTYITGQYQCFEREEAAALARVLNAAVARDSAAAPPFTAGHETLRRVGLDPEEQARHAAERARNAEPPLP
jgi:hypothetical protein